MDATLSVLYLSSSTGIKPDTNGNFGSDLVVLLPVSPDPHEEHIIYLSLGYTTSDCRSNIWILPHGDKSSFSGRQFYPDLLACIEYVEICVLMFIQQRSTVLVLQSDYIKLAHSFSGGLASGVNSESYLLTSVTRISLVAIVGDSELYRISAFTSWTGLFTVSQFHGHSSDLCKVI